MTEQVYLHQVWKSINTQCLWWIGETDANTFTSLVVRRADDDHTAAIGCKLTRSGFFKPERWTLCGEMPDFDTAVAAAALGAFD